MVRCLTRLDDMETQPGASTFQRGVCVGVWAGVCAVIAKIVRLWPVCVCVCKVDMKDRTDLK